jgi:hypothetical protein
MEQTRKSINKLKLALVAVGACAVIALSATGAATVYAANQADQATQLIADEQGQRTSSDDGANWYVNATSESTDADDSTLYIKQDGDNTQYSTDGKTWSSEKPADSSVSVAVGIAG